MLNIINNRRPPRVYCFIVGATYVVFICVVYSYRLRASSSRIGLKRYDESHNVQPEDIKYILQWGPTSSPFDIMGQGRDEFIRHGCEYYNCFVTDDRNYFSDLTHFDAVVFNGKYITSSNDLPLKRSKKQKFIFAATESAHNYRICDSAYDGYFNWTWTYRLDSDIRWAYITIYDLQGHIIGPKIDMTWPKLDPIREELKTSLSTKKKVAAWFVSHCNTLSRREQFVKDLQREIQLKKYSWNVDVYGPCGEYKCPRSRENECYDTLKRDYYFYFSFENSYAEDYVTEKLLSALNNNAVPVVLGAANYSRYRLSRHERSTSFTNSLVLIAIRVTYNTYNMIRTQENLQLFKIRYLIVGTAFLGLIYMVYSYHLNALPFNKYSSEIVELSPIKSAERLKYILQWGTRDSPFNIMGQGQDNFKAMGCRYSNCFVTDNKTYFPDLKQFDAIAFSGKQMPNAKDLPSTRSETQKYIFAAAESAHNYRVCDRTFDGFFNWTWTYRLDSDIRWAYITIYDMEGHIVGPNINMTWPQLDPISEEMKTSLSCKKKMVAWFVSHCHTLSKREQFVMDLQVELIKKGYNWTVDVYGPCGSLRCPRSRKNDCFRILKKDYYFYFSFENSYAEDYVTEKLLNALNHDTVPIVLGAADYSRFLPPGSYLDALELGVSELAEAMDAIYKNSTAYYEFFRWQNHFKYKHTIESDVCNLCAALNDEEALKRTSVYKDFRRWWNDALWDGTDKHC